MTQRAIKNCSRGFTLIEVLVSVAILMVGIALIWNALGGLNRVDHRFERMENLFEMAVSDLERQRILPLGEVIDTTHETRAIGGKTYWLKRTVLDAGDKDSLAFEEGYSLGSSTKRAAPPLEIKVELFESDPAGLVENASALVSLTAIRPDYTW